MYRLQNSFVVKVNLSSKNIKLYDKADYYLQVQDLAHIGGPPGVPPLCFMGMNPPSNPPSNVSTIDSGLLSPPNSLHMLPIMLPPAAAELMP